MLPAQERIPGHRHEAGLERTEDTMKRDAVELATDAVFAREAEAVINGLHR